VIRIVGDNNRHETFAIFDNAVSEQSADIGKCTPVMLCQVQVEVRKKWQHCIGHRFDGVVASRRLASTSTYAAVPPNDGARRTAAHHGQVPAQAPPPPHRQVPAQVDSGAPAPGAGGRRLPQPGDQSPPCDVIDDTVTSWLPDDAKRGCHGSDGDDGCHGYADVSEGDDDAHRRQQQHGRDAMCMTRLDRH